MLDDISADYVAGVLDVRSQVSFDLDLPDSVDKSPTVDWSIRISLGNNDPLAGLLEEYLHACDIHTTFRRMPSLKTDIRRQSQASLLAEELDGHSIELMRALSFVKEYDFTQECIAKDEKSLVRFAKTLEEIQPSRRHSGPAQYSARKLARQLNLRARDTTPYELPEITVNTPLPPDYMGGVYDACQGFSFRVAKDSAFDLNYSIHPVVHFNRTTRHPVTVSAIKTTLNDHGIEFRENSETDVYTLDIVLHGHERIGAFFDAFSDHIHVSLPVLEMFFQEIYPRYEQELHKSKQGFYDLLYIGEKQLDVFKRKRKYDLSYFATKWGDEIDTYGI